MARDASRLGASAGSSLVQHSAPGFEFLQSFFATWLKLDITQLAAALTIFSTISSAGSTLQALSLKLYWYFTKFFTASISIASSDRLNREILNWLGAQVLEKQATRVLTARTETIQTDAYWRPRRTSHERNDYNHEKRVPIQYLPTFGTTWFILERNFFLVRRIAPRSVFANGIPEEYAAAPEGDEPLVVMCLGRSVKPIKRFLDHCRDFAAKQRESYITIRATKAQFHGDSWDTTILRPIRPLETVHFDETTKAELVADIENYLDPATRRFYTTRGIPYRRGYLLHGPPGTGKTSLSLALAGYFGLELYLVHLPSIREDNELEKLFTALPPRCLVLLEDIDAIGVKRQLKFPGVDDDDDEKDDSESDDDDDDKSFRASRCTLSGLLNVLDGVTSQEGRIVLMTSNMAHKLDQALIRPGRIDRMIFLGNISPRSTELMFLRMYTRDHTSGSAFLESSFGLKEGELGRLALEFSSQIPDNTFTPAQLQGYLLNCRNSPARAAEEIKAWVEEEKKKADEVDKRNKKAKEWRAKKRRDRAMKALAKTMEDVEVDDEFDKLKAEVEEKRKRVPVKKKGKFEPETEEKGTGDEQVEEGKAEPESGEKGVDDKQIEKPKASINGNANGDKGKDEETNQDPPGNAHGTIAEGDRAEPGSDLGPGSEEQNFHNVVDGEGKEEENVVEKVKDER
jgi:chaperone BCS1